MCESVRGSHHGGERGRMRVRTPVYGESVSGHVCRTQQNILSRGREEEIDVRERKRAK